MQDYIAIKLRSIRLTPRYARMHYRIMHVRTLITRRTGLVGSLSLSLSLSDSLSFSCSLTFLSPSPSLSCPGSLVSNLSKTRREARGMIETKRKWMRWSSHVSMMRNDAAFLIITFRNPDYSHEFHSGQINRRRWRQTL